MTGPFVTGREPEEISEVNVVPLADVSLVLLIILLVLSPMMAQHRLQVQAAAEKAPADAEEPAPAPEKPVDLVVVVGLAPDRATVGDRVFTGDAELVSYLAGLLLPRSDRKVFLAPRPEVTHGRVVEAIERLKSAGASSVALVQSAPEPG